MFIGYPGGHVSLYWGCIVSCRCWDWGTFVLQLVSLSFSAASSLRPGHILVAEALPPVWEVPTQLWDTLRAILCWLIWKDRNGHVFGGERSEVLRVINLAWHRLMPYLHVAWRVQLQQVRLGQFSLFEAQTIMATQFGRAGILWSLHEVSLHVPPVPPRPP